MLSPKRCAQLGLGAAGAVLLSSVLVLLVGASDVTATASANPSSMTAARPIAVVSGDALSTRAAAASR